MLNILHGLIGYVYIFLEKCLFTSFAHFKIGLSYIIEYWVLYTFWIQVPLRYKICKYFFPFCGLSFQVFWWYHLQHKHFNCEVQQIHYFACAFGDISKNHCWTQGHKIYTYDFFYKFYSFIIHLGLWLLWNKFCILYEAGGSNFFFLLHGKIQLYTPTNFFFLFFGFFFFFFFAF